MTELPNKLSDLLEAALTDLAAVEKDPRYRVDMGTWHTPEGADEVCQVCLAGAVMAKSLGCNPLVYLEPFEVPDPWKLEALDFLRKGVIPFIERDEGGKSAAFEFGENFRPHKLSRTVRAYRDDPGGWREDMRKLLADLREAGL